MDLTPEIKVKIACDMLKYKFKLHFEFKHLSRFRKRVMFRLYKRKLVMEFLKEGGVKSSL